MALDPLTAAALISGGSKLIPGAADLLGFDIFGGPESASRARRKGMAQARSDITGGYGRARGYEEPIYGTGLGAYQRLAGEYGRGELEQPEFKFDPMSIYQDPEFKAAMGAGTAALGSSAEAKGDLFSTASQQAQQKFGQDLFARRSDELFNRAKDVYGLGRERLEDRFRRGMTLAQPGLEAAPRLGNLTAEEAKLLSGLSEQSAEERANQLAGRPKRLQELLGTGTALLGIK